MFCWPRSASTARSQVWLGLPNGRFQSGGSHRITAATARWWSSYGELRAIMSEEPQTYTHYYTLKTRKKSTILIDLLKVERLVKQTVSGRLFHTLMTAFCKQKIISGMHCCISLCIICMHALWWTTGKLKKVGRKTQV